MTKEELDIKTAELRAKIELASAWTNDTDALEIIELFPAWTAGRSVIVGERLQHGGKLYKCVQAHTTQAGWEPDLTPALWVRISVEEWPEFVQPTGAADAYQLGNKVTFEGKHYISLINANVWSPTAYPAGWELQQ